MSDGELAWTSENKPLRSATINRGALKGSVHPTQKPVAIYDFTNDFLKIPKSAVVLDLFSGSGTLSIVGENRGQRAFMMERDEGYCDAIVKRWEEYTGKKAVHAEMGVNFGEASSICPGCHHLRPST